MIDIPKVIHQTSPSDKNLWHPIWHKCHESWKKNFPETEYEHIMWTDEMIDDFIEKKYSQYWKIYNTFPLHIMKLDFFRYCVLFEYGGIYADMDMYCYKNFFESLNGECFLIESYYEEEKVQNCLLSCKKNNLFMGDCIKKSIENFLELFKVTPIEQIQNPEDMRSSIFVKSTFGPQFLTKMYEYYLNKNNINTPSILQKENYNNHHLTYSKNYLTKHMLTGRWGKDQILQLLDVNKTDFPQYDHQTFLKLGYFGFRNIDIDNYNFEENYIQLD